MRPTPAAHVQRNMQIKGTMTEKDIMRISQLWNYSQSWDISSQKMSTSHPNYKQRGFQPLIQECGRRNQNIWSIWKPTPMSIILWLVTQYIDEPFAWLELFSACERTAYMKRILNTLKIQYRKALFHFPLKSLISQIHCWRQSYLIS